MVEIQIIKPLLAIAYQHPEMGMDNMLKTINFNKINREEIIEKIPELEKEFSEIRFSKDSSGKVDWIMGKLHWITQGNMALQELSSVIKAIRE